MKKDLTKYTDRELSLTVLNDEDWYDMIGSEDLLEAIDVAFIYTDEQMEDLLETLTEEEVFKQNERLTMISPSLWSLMEMGIKTTGEYVGSLSFIGDSLTYKQYYTLKNFYEWIEDGPEIKEECGTYPARSIGHGNYKERYQEFLKDTNEKQIKKGLTCIAFIRKIKCYEEKEIKWHITHKKERNQLLLK